MGCQRGHAEMKTGTAHFPDAVSTGEKFARGIERFGQNSIYCARGNLGRETFNSVFAAIFAEFHAGRE